MKMKRIPYTENLIGFERKFKKFSREFRSCTFAPQAKWMGRETCNLHDLSSTP